MKLRSNDEAILTLSPKMCKDKLMQAAGRMRLLGMDQRLRLVSPPDVSMQICTLLKIGRADIKPRHVLQWTMANTVSWAAHWLLEFAKQGGHQFLVTHVPAKARVPDQATVQDLYSRGWGDEEVIDTWLRQISNMTDKPIKQRVCASKLCIGLGQITEHMMKYGMGQKARISNFDEECEREVEKEVEIETEEEREVVPAEPCAESEWDLDKFLRCATSQRQEMEKFTVLSEFMCTEQIELTCLREVKTTGKKTPGIEWSSNVYCSPNFLRTIETFTVLNEYLRFIDHAVLLPGTGILLISQREANTMTNLLQHNSHTNNAQLVNLCYLRDTCDTTAVGNSVIPSIALALGSCVCQSTTIEDATMASLQLFNGEATFATDKRREAVRSMLSNSRAKLEAQAMVRTRGLQAYFPRSHLEEIVCEEAP